MLRVVARVRSAELEQALLLLPFTDALRLMRYLVSWLRQGGQVGAWWGRGCETGQTGLGVLGMRLARSKPRAEDRLSAAAMIGNFLRLCQPHPVRTG